MSTFLAPRPHPASAANETIALIPYDLVIDIGSADEVDQTANLARRPSARHRLSSTQG